ncbi:MAG: ATP-grasp domain-containing protein [Alphaproteobacteria bacterium]|nr:ATP-grasp domain-containing protein [Alphaproteobacteria bacterium]MDX5370511.1 ATP-grasp domain-containing protein [Alphaproteobacteria bacterium]
MTPPDRIVVLIAGIAGASLGTEIAKSLRLAGGYRILGCDINPRAYGRFDETFDAAFLADPDAYVDSVAALAADQGAQVLIPGGEAPARLIAAAADRFEAMGVRVAQNAPGVVALAGDKAACFERLAALGIPIPETRPVAAVGDVEGFPMPCVVKPSAASGGSSFVFFARTEAEAGLYASYLINNGLAPLLQRYVPEAGGEYTVGVLSLPDGAVAGAIALRRTFDAKLSIMTRGADFLISSGYSQGRIEAYPDICAAATRIAEALGSGGPLNVQGRVDPAGVFIPFEVNPRFSASTHLRSLAGFNEVDFFVRHLMGRKPEGPLKARPGWYLRSLTETVADPEADPA